MRLMQGQMQHILPLFPSNSFDSCVTDPPYHLASVVARFGKPDAAPAGVGATGAYARASAGFMGKEWDGGDVAFDAATWAHVMRVLKPGGHLVAFAHSRNYHRMACAIEDAGFTIRDQIMWLYGSGFPKSHNVGDGIGTALKPAHEPIVLARKPISESTIAANVLRWGTGGLNIEASKVGDDIITSHSAPSRSNTNTVMGKFVAPTRPPRVGRHPANVIHDGLDEPWAKYFYHAKAGQDERVKRCNCTPARQTYSKHPCMVCMCIPLPTHPTVKPLALMRYLVGLVTPPGGIVLDPFAGTGSTLVAASQAGFDGIGIEMEIESHADALWRLEQLL